MEVFDGKGRFDCDAFWEKYSTPPIDLNEFKRAALFMLSAKKEEKMQLFEYAVYYISCTTSDKSEIVIQPTTVLAPSEEVVRRIAARAIPDEYADRLAKLTVAVRPFV